MNAQQSQAIAEAFIVSKDIIAIFSEAQVGQKRIYLLKWIRDLLEKPKHAVKEEERLKAIDNDTKLISEISNGDSMFRMAYFNRIVDELLNEFRIAPIKEGNVFVRSFTLKIWKLKKARLDVNKRVITLLSKKEKVLSLQSYVVKWIGQKKEYQCFVMDSLSQSNRYKQILFGWHSFQGSRVWHDAILRCRNEIPNSTVDDMFIPSSSAATTSVGAKPVDLNKSYAHPMSGTSLPSSSNDLKLIYSTGKLDDELCEVEKAEKPKEPLAFTSMHQAQSHTGSTIHQNNAQAKNQSSILQENKGNKKSEISKSLIAPSSNSVIEGQSSKEKQPLASSSSVQPKSPVEQKGKESQKTSPQPSSDTIAAKKANQTVQVSSDVKKETQSQSTNSNETKTKKDGEKEQQQQIQQAEDEEQKSLVDMSQLLRSNTDTIEEKRTPPAIQQFLAEYSLDSLATENNYKTISFNGGMRFLQNNDDPRLFKIFLAFQGVTAFDAFNCICCTDDYNKWNNNVAETRLLNVMKNETTALIYQKHKGIGIMYRPRDFVYMRHAFLQKDTYFLIDKSIQYESLPSSISVVRGEIEHVVWSFQPHPSDETRSLMIAEFFYNNSGYSNKEQDASITYTYLQNFSHLADFLAQKSFNNKATVNVFNLQDNGLQRRSVLKQAFQQEQQSYLVNGEDLLYSHEVTRSVFPQNTQAKPQGSVIAEQDEEDEDKLSNGKGAAIDDEADDDQEARAANYMEEERLNAQLNSDLRKFSIANLMLEETERSSSSGQSSLNQQARTKGDKLADLSIPQILELVDKNKHWGLCVDQIYSMSTIPHTENRLVSDAVNGHYQFKKDWERDAKTGKFIFLNKDKIQAQKKVISFILSKIGSNIISGKSITSISLPIDIFESRSNLERFAYSCSFAPVYLRRAGELTNPIDQMKNVGIYLITTTIMYLNLEKPFNPILGETFQGRLDGDPFYVEQISHHPPICAYQYYTDSYMLSAQLESIANIHANSVTGINQGNIRVDFTKTKNQIGMIAAPGSLNGTAIGTRYMSVEGKYIAYDLKNKLVFEVKVNPEKKGLFKSATMPIDYFAGGIYRVTDKFIAKFKSLKPSYYKFQGLNMKEDVVEQVSTINGIWNDHVMVDDVKMFDIKDPTPYALEYEVNPIASDSNYRQDILALRDGNKKIGQEYKEKLEVFQRNDRKLREKAAETRKKLLKKAKK